MDPSHGFGTSTLFGVPSNDLMTNVLYMNQAQLHASNNPYDVHVQRQFQYWQAVVRQQQAAMAAMPTAAPQAPPAPAPVQPVPSGLSGASGGFAIPQMPTAHLPQTSTNTPSNH